MTSHTMSEDVTHSDQIDVSHSVRGCHTVTRLTYHTASGGEMTYHTASGGGMTYHTESGGEMTYHTASGGGDVSHSVGRG